MDKWLRLHAANVRGLGSIPGQGTRSHTLQLRVHVPQLKIPHAAANMEDPVCAAAKSRHRRIVKKISKMIRPSKIKE